VKLSLVVITLNGVRKMLVMKGITLLREMRKIYIMEKELKVSECLLIFY